MPWWMPCWRRGCPTRPSWRRSRQRRSPARWRGRRRSRFCAGPLRIRCRTRPPSSGSTCGCGRPGWTAWRPPPCWTRQRTRRSAGSHACGSGTAAWRPSRGPPRRPRAPRGSLTWPRGCGGPRHRLPRHWAICPPRWRGRPPPPCTTGWTVGWTVVAPWRCWLTYCAPTRGHPPCRRAWPCPGWPSGCCGRTTLATSASCTPW